MTMRALIILAATTAAVVQACPAGANCYHGPPSGGTWFAGPWSLTRTPTFPDTAVMTGSNLSLKARDADGAAKRIVLEDSVLVLEEQVLELGPRDCWRTEREVAPRSK